MLASMKFYYEIILFHFYFIHFHYLFYYYYYYYYKQFMKYSKNKN